MNKAPIRPTSMWALARLCVPARLSFILPETLAHTRRGAIRKWPFPAGSEQGWRKEHDRGHAWCIRVVISPEEAEG